MISKNIFCQSYVWLVLCIFLTSCTPVSPPLLQPQINHLVLSGNYQYAESILEDNRLGYGKQNQMLYLLDAGMVAHLSGDYQASINYFEDAKKMYDKLFTVSLSNQASTWLINDKRTFYRGEDFERVMINIVQAINFAMLNNIEEALVEARDVDQQLKLINQQYKEGQKNKYDEDAMARLLMGSLYEAEGSLEGLDDAYISYKKSLVAYEDQFYQDADVEVPRILKENLLALSQVVAPDEFDQWRQRFPGVDYLSVKDKRKKGEIFIIIYDGVLPLKQSTALPIPLPNGLFGKLSFPSYEKYYPLSTIEDLKLINKQHQTSSHANVELLEDVSYLAQSSLNDRKGRVIAKSALRNLAKFALEETQEDIIYDKWGENSATAFRYIASLYNIVSEEPDLRSWQTLPAQIKMSRMVVEPGEYELNYQGEEIGTLKVSAGQKQFFILREAEEIMDNSSSVEQRI